MSGASGERGVSRGRGRGRRGRGRGWRGGERDRQSWGEVFAVGPAPGLRGSFPRPPGRGRGVELCPSLQPDHMPSWFSGPQWYPGRGRGFVQPPHFPPPAFAPTLYPSAPPLHPSSPPRHPAPRHPSTPPRHPTPHGRYSLYRLVGSIIGSCLICLTSGGTPCSNDLGRRSMNLSKWARLCPPF